MYKNLTTKMISKPTSRVKTIMLEERNPYATTPIVGTVQEEPDKGIMQLCEGEHMRLQEAIR